MSDGELSRRNSRVTLIDLPSPPALPPGLPTYLPTYPPFTSHPAPPQSHPGILCHARERGQRLYRVENLHLRERLVHACVCVCVYRLRWCTGYGTIPLKRRNSLSLDRSIDFPAVRSFLLRSDVACSRWRNIGKERERERQIRVGASPWIRDGRREREGPVR